jgi:hypothetical protein
MKKVWSPGRVDSRDFATKAGMSMAGTETVTHRTEGQIKPAISGGLIIQADLKLERERQTAAYAAG